jgi:hypothetical protein
VDSRAPLSRSLLAKVAEQAKRAQHLILLIPAGKLDWRPEVADAVSIGELLGHLLECLAGFCAALYALHPGALEHFAGLRTLPVNHSCQVDEARRRIADYMSHIDEGFRQVTDEDLAKPIPTVFIPEGEPALAILLGNLEHLINHKYQLFFYLKLLGVSVSTPDLYQLRGQQPPSTNEDE